jgi:hypothetical protein
MRAAAVALLALSLAACGSNGGKSQVATAGGTASASGGSGTGQKASAMSTEEKMRRFTACMQENGVDMVIAGAAGGVRAGDKGAAPPKAGSDSGGSGRSLEDDPKFKNAIEACRQYEPSGGEAPKPNPEQLEKLRAFTKCMRENGVDMPDPQGDTGGGAIALGDGPNGVDPTSSKFKKAEEECRDLMPGRPGSGIGRAG